MIEGAQSEVPLSTARAWTEALPKGRLLLIDDAGHANWLDQPEAFRDAVSAFLDEKPAGVATFSILGYDPKTGEAAARCSRASAWWRRRRSSNTTAVAPDVSLWRRRALSPA